MSKGTGRLYFVAFAKQMASRRDAVMTVIMHARDHADSLQ